MCQMCQFASATAKLLTSLMRLERTHYDNIQLYMVLDSIRMRIKYEIKLHFNDIKNKTYLIWSYEDRSKFGISHGNLR